MKKTALAIAIVFTAALAGCHHNKPANNGGDMGSGAAMGSASAGGSGAMAGSGDMGGSAAGGGGSGM